MRKTRIILLCLVIFLLIYLTVVSAEIVFRSDSQLPKAILQKQDQPRLVLITQDTETPFWDKVGKGAEDQAHHEGASLEVWGSYGKNHEDFLKKLEIAIHSKIDGIIIQGLDSEEFTYLTKVKASFYGIPIITIANDVPMQESLRRTYVGSDQYKAGQMIANQLISDMGTTGNVILTYSSNEEYYQKQRLDGIKDTLEKFPSIKTVLAETSSEREQIITTTQDMLNKNPNIDAFIIVNSNIVGDLVNEIGKRSQIAPYHIYSFDEGPDSLSLLTNGQLDGIVEQSPEKMGQTSVKLIMDWLNGDTLPLDLNGYFTPIRILKATDVQ